jgi:hypothetical protein
MAGALGWEGRSRMVEMFSIPLMQNFDPAFPYEFLEGVSFPSNRPVSDAAGNV